MNESNQLLNCGDRFSISEQPWCEEFFHLLHLMPIEGFEQSSHQDSSRDFLQQLQKPVRSRLYAVEATEEHLAHILECVLLGASRDLEKEPTHVSVITAEAKAMAKQLWQSYGNNALRRCHSLHAPLVCQDIELAVVIQHRQCWQPDGYWRGELLNSLSLAPGEELTVEMFSWDRHKIERERSTDASAESSESGTLTSRSSSEVVTNAEFRMKAGAEGNIGGSLALQDMDIPVDVNGNIGANFEAEFKGAVTSTQTRLNEATRTVSNTLRTSRKTRVVETAEFGSETRATRRIKNENHCHTINYDYFEILEQYQVSVTTENVQFVALVPLPSVDEIDANWILCHEYPLRTHLRHRIYERGFEAARVLQTAAILRQQLTPNLTPPAPVEVVTNEEREPKDTLGDHLRVFVKAIIKAKDRLAGASASSNDYGNLFNFDSTIRKAAFRRISKVVTREFVLAVYTDLFSRINELAAHQNEEGTVLATHLQIFKDQVLATGLMSLVTQPLKLDAYPLLIFAYDDEGLIGAMDSAFTQLDNLDPALTVQTGADALLPPGPSETGDEGNPVVVQTLTLSPTEQMLDERFGLETLAEAEVELERLLCHVQENLDYYRTILFTHRGSQAVDELLASCPQVALMVERRVIGVQNGKALFPLRPFLQRERRDKIKDMLTSLGGKNEKQNQYSVMLPTAGTVLEARLGQCNACEPFVQEHRVQDLNLRKAEVALAEATAAQAVETARRYQLRLDATPAQLDAPEQAEMPVIRLQMEGGLPARDDHDA